jgi:hypothetical protein
MFFKIIGRISDVETIASGKGIRERQRLRKLYGGQRWRKLKRKRSGQVGGWYDMSCRSALVRSRHWRKGIQDQAHFGNLMKRTEPRFVVCVKNKDYPASLELRKLYQVVSDETAAKLHHYAYGGVRRLTNLFVVTGMK